MVRRGDIFTVNFEPRRGSDQGGWRPAVVVSNDVFNKHSPVVTAAPLTHTKRKNRLPHNVEIPPGVLDKHGVPSDSDESLHFQCTSNCVMPHTWDFRYTALSLKKAPVPMPKTTQSLLAILLSSCLFVGCSSDEQSFCNSAQDIQNSVEGIDLTDITAAISPDFWSDLQSSLNDLERETSGDLNDSVQQVQSDLNSLIARLKDADYDLAKILLSPETLSDLTLVTSALVGFVANQLQEEVDATCTK